MNTGQTLQIDSTSSAETERIAATIGAKLRGGEVLELISDLGGGKTTFVRGLARGFGSHDKVASPTFTISREYSAGDKRLVHFDFYRLQDPGLVANELEEFIGDPQTVVVIEWAGIVEDVLPPDRLTVTIAATGENDRQLTFAYPEKLAYLVENKT